MMNWLYENKEIDNIGQIPLGCIGFVYIIKHPSTGYYYIGKKSLQSTVNKKLGKKEIKALAELGGRGRPATKKKIVSESNWKDYYGSSKEFQNFVKEMGKETFTREILHYCFSSKEMSYNEVKLQFQYNVLEDKMSFNDNILGKFYRKDIK